MKRHRQTSLTQLLKVLRRLSSTKASEENTRVEEGEPHSTVQGDTFNPPIIQLDSEPDGQTGTKEDGLPDNPSNQMGVASQSQCSPPDVQQHREPDNQLADSQPEVITSVGDPHDFAQLLKPEFRLTVLSDNDIKQWLDTPRCPAGDFEFASYSMKNGKRTVKYSFCRPWLHEFPWLCYSPELQGGLCRTCIIFGNKNERYFKPAQALVTMPFTKFSKAKGQDGKLTLHETNHYHVFVCHKEANFRSQLVESASRVDSQLNKQARKHEEDAKKVLSALFKSIIFCGTYGLPLRGHRDHGKEAQERANKGVYLGLLEFEAEHNQILMQSPSYTCSKKCHLHILANSE